MVEEKVLINVYKIVKTRGKLGTDGACIHICIAYACIYSGPLIKAEDRLKRERTQGLSLHSKQ